MTEKKAYTVTDLGGGDGGKGGVVHKLCSLRKPHTVIKVGGAQGHHGVTTSRGEQFAFSQFGCGTFGMTVHRFVRDIQPARGQSIDQVAGVQPGERGAGLPVVRQIGLAELRAGFFDDRWNCHIPLLTFHAR